MDKMVTYFGGDVLFGVAAGVVNVTIPAPRGSTTSTDDQEEIYRGPTTKKVPSPEDLHLRKRKKKPPAISRELHS